MLKNADTRSPGATDSASATASRQRKRGKARRNTELIKARLVLGLTPNDLARRADVHGNTVRAAERGLYVDPRSQLAIAKAVERDVLELFPIERQRIPS